LVIDQITKTIAIRDLVDGPVHVIGPLSFILGFNTGIAFSLFTGVGLPIILFAVCLVGFVVWLMRGVPTVFGSIAVGLVIGGSIGNLVDRLFRASGAVVDFIRVGFWPMFNLADASVVLGTFLLVIFFLRADHGQGSTGSAPS
jgi:signal peptidase II